MTESLTGLAMVPLGATGADISAKGLGTAIFGSTHWEGSWGTQDDQDSIAVVHRAVERGITWLDTAPSYGRGHAEHVVGRALQALAEGERPLVFTKCGLVWSEGDAESRCVLAPSSVRAECDASLRRLGVERLDLLECHCPTEDGTPLEETWGAMAELVDAGKVRWIGLSNFPLEDLAACEAQRHVDVVQPALSLVDRAAAADVLPWARAHGTGVITYAPLAHGLLSGHLSRAAVEQLDTSDWRRTWPGFQGSSLEAALDLVDRLAPLAERHAVSVAGLALAWVRAWPGVTATIVGAREPAELDEWVADDVDFSAAELDEIAGWLERLPVGVGPVHPGDERVTP